MPEVRDAAASAVKWLRNAGQAAQSYIDGVGAPRRDWARSTLAAAGSYTNGLQAAISRKSWDKGISRAGTARQQAKSLAVGAARYPQGVMAGEEDYRSRVAPYLEVIKSTTLPPRGAKGSPGNLQRVAAIATALRAKKESM
jgi:hypothetical protein